MVEEGKLKGEAGSVLEGASESEIDGVLSVLFRVI